LIFCFVGEGGMCFSFGYSSFKIATSSGKW
jgi:hypothetical protein